MNTPAEQQAIDKISKICSEGIGPLSPKYHLEHGSSKQAKEIDSILKPFDPLAQQKILEQAESKFSHDTAPHAYCD